MTPIRINLLSHREARRVREARAFALLALFAVVLGLALVALVDMILSDAIEAQTRRNDFLREEIAKLDRQIREIQKLKEKTEVLIARQSVVESIQANRTVPVHLLYEVARLLPEGMVLTALRQNGQKLMIEGHAPYSALVSDYMRSLEASDWFDKANLIEIKAISNPGKIKTNAFSMTIEIVLRQSQAAENRP